MIHQPICLIHNAGALGDLVASLSSVKYAVEKVWTNQKYHIFVKDYFRQLFYFVPDSNIHSIDEKFELFERHSFVSFNDVVMTEAGPSSLITPMKLSLTDYASIKFLGKILDIEDKNYPQIPLNSTDISKFNLSKKYVCIINNISSVNRSIFPAEINKITNWLNFNSITPVFIGKSEVAFQSLNVKYSKQDNVDYTNSIDLTDKTSLLEAAKIMSESICVVGVDSGLIHLAGCTDTNIVCGYTTIDPKIRMPIRNNQLGYKVIPIVTDSSKCRFCQSDWYLNGWNFNNCYNNSNECAKEMTADKFILAIKSLL